ncbi:MAG: hypothetical protein BWY82_01154 [Verrucomicrobia bacterium ADurb.Bin474]|nr:MAG: hypothetical protein BWY82_01154 [Verrucomicrobia bacterium ADurb.Bin474]
MTQNIQKRFYHAELQELRDHLLLMATLAIESVSNTIQALESFDMDTAERVIRDDDQLDELEIRIDAEATRYISLRAPVASDVRLVMVAMKASHELERIGDEATGIAKRVMRLVGESRFGDTGRIKEMCALVLAQVRDAVRCLIDQDAPRAAGIPMRDKAIDEIHREHHTLFSDRIMGDPTKAGSLIELIFISKALERIGDHATNIAEEIVFLYQAEDIRHTDRVKRS